MKSNLKFCLGHCAHVSRCASSVSFFSGMFFPLVRVAAAGSEAHSVGRPEGRARMRGWLTTGESGAWELSTLLHASGLPSLAWAQVTQLFPHHQAKSACHGSLRNLGSMTRLVPPPHYLTGHCMGKSCLMHSGLEVQRELYSVSLICNSIITYSYLFYPGFLF